MENRENDSFLRKKRILENRRNNPFFNLRKKLENRAYIYVVVSNTLTHRL